MKARCLARPSIEPHIKFEHNQNLVAPRHSGVPHHIQREEYAYVLTAGIVASIVLSGIMLRYYAQVLKSKPPSISNHENNRWVPLNMETS